VQYLTNLESLKCHRCHLTELDVSGLKNLKELCCSNNDYMSNDDKKINNLDRYEAILKELKKKKEELNDYFFVKEELLDRWISYEFLSKLNVQGCESLEILDCAENSLEELELINLPNLKTVSCKINLIRRLTITNCPNLRQLDASRLNEAIDELEFSQINITDISANNLRVLYCDKINLPPN